MAFELQVHKYTHEEYQESATTTLTDLMDIQLHFSWQRQVSEAPIHNSLSSMHREERSHFQIRDLQSSDISKLVTVEGIVFNASRTSSKVTRAYMQCTNCKNEISRVVKPGYSGIQIPQRCEATSSDGNACPPNSYVIVPDRCKFVDQQTMKLQECPDSVPTGEMPRNIILTADRYLVERAPPGTRVIVVGIFSTFTSGKTSKGNAKAVSYPYIRVLGIEVNNMGAGRSDFQFDKEEEDKFRKFAKTPGLYDKIVNNIDPAIFGHYDIKKAIACQLFGGTRKTLPDGIKRRGDINVLLLGDPSTAKSQLLKFTEKVAPIGVYTSGKGSSAAGLTACIIKEKGSGEYYLEGGSMVLADGGIVCIDEFDKMRDQDRVAIHEAMEQQTISIAKAGITTVLNSRTSVLAAANPVYGRYDDMKSAEEQIDFQTTILSRFDMIFIVRDTKDRNQDLRIAEHVLNIHKNAKSKSTSTGELSIDYLKKYISYCRKTSFPTLSEEASEILKNYYVEQRSRNKTNDNMPVIPITVRQLEALVRISESLARMVLLDVATADHAREAINLFKSSTIEAINSGQVGDIASMSPEMSQEIQKCEDQIKKKLPIGSTMNQEALIAMLQRVGMQRLSVERAIFIMALRGEVEHRHKKRSIYRKR